MGLLESRTDAPGVAGQDQLRLRALQAGLAMVEANDVSTIHLAVGQVRLADVAAEMEVSRAAIYKLWPSQLDFRLDLAVHLVAATHEPLLPSGLAFGSGDTFAPSVRSGFEPILERQLSTQEDHAFRASLLAYTDGKGIHRRCSAIERTVREKDAKVLDTALRQSGRRVVDPLTPLDLAMMLRIAADGRVLLERRSPQRHRVRVGDEPSCDLLAYIAGCLLEGLTAPTTSPPAPAAEVPPDGSGDEDLPAWSPRQREVLVRATEMARASLRAGTTPQLGALGEVTLDQVARRLGEHRRTLYRCWPDHTAYRLDLLEYLSVRHRVRYEQAFDAAAAEAFAHPERLTLTVVEGVTSALYEFDDPEPIPRLALLAYTGFEPVRSLLDALGDDTRQMQISRVEALLELLGWTPRHGCTADHLAAVIGIFGLGGERMHHMDPTAIRRDLPYLDGNYSTVAIAQHVIEQLTIDKGGPPG
jgi:AcrR family transcriptional regulator